MHLLSVDQINMSWIDSSLLLQLLERTHTPDGMLGIAKRKLHHSKVTFNLSSAFLKGMPDSFLRASLIVLIIL